MSQFRRGIVLLLMLVTVTKGFAQSHARSYEGPGNWFVGIDVGASMAMDENVTIDNFFQTELPSGSIQLGRTLTPRWSVRLEGLFTSQLGHPSPVAVKALPDMFSDYRFLTGIGTLDVMMNLSNFCHPYDSRNWFDAYLVAGGGVLYRFGVDKKVESWYQDVYPVDAADKLFWTAHLGFEGAWHVIRQMDLVFEVDCFATDNAYNGVVGSNSPMDVFLCMRLGTVYYFRNGHKRHRFANPKKEHKYWHILGASGK